MKFIIEADNISISIILKDDDGSRISHCKISTNNTSWSITEWYTTHNYMHQGYGKIVLRKAVQELIKRGKPTEIRYVWNGANEYVMNWLIKHFDPVSILPLAVQKVTQEESWESHIYVLNKEKFLRYFLND